MLKRIKSIQNVGKFKSCRAAPIEFGNLNFIYGLNTYGKSTLGDIFSSLRGGDIAAIRARKTIPINSAPQEIELSFQAEGLQEVSVKYTGSSWTENFPEQLGLQVFDDGFYHKNLFSSRQFTRATKEAFSAFVLGEQGVSKAKEISEKNKKKGELVREIGKLKKNVFGEIENFAQFLAEDPEAAEQPLEEKISLLRAEFEGVKKQRDNIKKIISRKEFNTALWAKEFSKGFELINLTLSSSMRSHQEAARKVVVEHIANNFKGGRGAEAWIRQGLNFHKGGDCLFCGQYLTFEALDLINLYEQSFDASFENNSKSVAAQITSARASLSNNLIERLRLVIEGNKEALVSYPELDENEYFSKLRSLLIDVESELLSGLSKWGESSVRFFDELDQMIIQKKEVPNIALPAVDDCGLLEIDSMLNSLCAKYNDWAAQANDVIQGFKQRMNPAELNKKMEEITTEGKALGRKIRRVKLNAQCEEFLQLSDENERLSKEIPVLNEELRLEQSDFLKDYFLRVDEYFKKFGSEDFSLSKGEDNNGHTPILYLKVKFRGQDVSEKNLEQVFSESDRRALALSVFWAGVVGLESSDRKNSIVVLDDPVTSFDCNRMSSAHHEIFELAKSVRQVIVLSHFEHGVSAFLSVYRSQLPIKLISIVRRQDSSDLTISDIELFIATEHEKRRSKILSFISCETEFHSAADLRVFLENELASRFAQQISLSKISEVNLSDRIDRLKEAGAISEVTAQAAHGLRVLLNPSHHLWMSNNVEDQRGVAKKLMVFIYEKLIPVP